MSSWLPFGSDRAPISRPAPSLRVPYSSPMDAVAGEFPLRSTGASRAFGGRGRPRCEACDRPFFCSLHAPRNSGRHGRPRPDPARRRARARSRGHFWRRSCWAFQLSNGLGLSSLGIAARFRPPPIPAAGRRGCRCARRTSPARAGYPTGAPPATCQSGFAKGTPALVNPVKHLAKAGASKAW